MKNSIKKLLALFGLKMQQIDTPMRSLERGLIELSKYIEVQSVIDIGVANGTPELYAAFPAEKYNYLLIEADPANRGSVEILANKLHAVFAIVFCGSHKGSVRLNIHPNREYSSAFKLLAPYEQVGAVDVPVDTLDNIVREKGLHGHFLVKIDAEGAELEVLQGAPETLRQAEAVVVETSVAKKYEGGAEMGDVISFMKERGFSVFDMLAGANRNKKLYQLDLVFVRTGASFRE